jgi:hypothetical protein
MGSVSAIPSGVTRPAVGEMAQQRKDPFLDARHRADRRADVLLLLCVGEAACEPDDELRAAPRREQERALDDRQMRGPEDPPPPRAP